MANQKPSFKLKTFIVAHKRRTVFLNSFQLASQASWPRIANSATNVRAEANASPSREGAKLGANGSTGGGSDEKGEGAGFPGKLQGRAKSDVDSLANSLTHTQ